MYEDVISKYDKKTTGNGPKKTFATAEEWHAWVQAMAGSITDETFVEPEDAYFDYDEVPNFDEVLSGR